MRQVDWSVDCGTVIGIVHAVTLLAESATAATSVELVLLLMVVALIRFALPPSPMAAQQQLVRVHDTRLRMVPRLLAFNSVVTHGNGIDSRSRCMRFYNVVATRRGAC